MPACVLNLYICLSVVNKSGQALNESDMKNKLNITGILLIFILAINLVSCHPKEDPQDEEFTIIAEIKSDVKSPFFVDFDNYPERRNTLPVGVFDSGTGGLAVLNAIFEMDQFNNANHQTGTDGLSDFKNERFIYLADEANMPYGRYDAEGKADFLRELVIKDVRFLLDEDYYISPYDSVSKTDKSPVKAIVIACNTATAYGLETVKKAMKEWGLDVPVFGIVDAGSKNALDLMNAGEMENGVVGILATEGTCSSEGYPMAIEKNSRQKFPGAAINVVQQPGIGLAGAIDGDLNYIDPSATEVRNDEAYKGPKLNDPAYSIDTSLWAAYNFGENDILTEKNEAGERVTVQLNSVAGYVKYAVTHLVENTLSESPGNKLNSVILGCTHYPYVDKEIGNHLLYLSQLNERYDEVIADDIRLIDPAESLATELYRYLAENRLWNNSNFRNSRFFISVPNPLLETNKIEKEREFPYEYKYGRDINSSRQFVKIVPFSDQWIDAEIKNRIQTELPVTFKTIYKN